MGTEQETLIYIEDQDKLDASVAANAFAHKDVKNRAYFIAEFTNKLNEFMGKVYKNNSRNEEPIKATKDVSLEQIMKKFKTVSDEFFEEYKTKGDRNIF